MVYVQLPPEENCPQLGFKLWSRLGLILGLGDNQTIAPLGNCTMFRVRGQFWCWRAIVLEPIFLTFKFQERMNVADSQYLQSYVGTSDRVNDRVNISLSRSLDTCGL